ncbi:MAG TPA: GxxExxY protein [Cyclobacteriaceae bacterium]|nr:GxxExxY protein [Cyclobacteriaceae bacterium]
MKNDGSVTKKIIDQLSYDVIGAAIEVHKNLGPGLLESIYHKCLKEELLLRGHSVQSELYVRLFYKGKQLEAELRCDLLVDDLLVVEIKAVEAIIPIFEAQVLTYMRLLEVPKGLILNFNCVNIFKVGQKTFVNELYRALPDM